MSTRSKRHAGRSRRRRGRRAQPSEEELRAAYEAELSRITSADMIAAGGGLAAEHRRLPARAAAAPAQGAPRPPSGRDLEQVRDAIDGVRALLAILERRIPSELAPAARRALAAADGLRARGAGERRRAAARRGGRAGRGEPPAGERGAPSAEPRRAGEAPAPASEQGSSGPGPGGVQRAAVGARAAEAGRAAAWRWRGTFAGRHDRLRRAFAPGRRSSPSDPGDKCARDDPRAARQSDRGGFLLSSFLTNHGVVVALVCAACAVVYGLRDHALPARALAGQRADAEHLARRPAGRARLPEPSVHDDRGRRRGAVRRADLRPEHRRRRAASRSAACSRARPATSA